MPEAAPRYHLLPETYQPQSCGEETCGLSHGASPQELQKQVWPLPPLPLPALPPLQAALATLWRQEAASGGLLLREALAHLLAADSAADQTYLLYHLKQQAAAFEGLALPQTAAWAAWAVRGLDASWEELVAERYSGDGVRARARGLARLQALQAPREAASYPQGVAQAPGGQQVPPTASEAKRLGLALLPLVPEHSLQAALAAGESAETLWPSREGFKLLAAGLEHNVFLHGESNLVFKHSPQGVSLAEEAARYERLGKRQEELSALRAAYCASAYLFSSQGELLVQEYLQPERHRPLAVGEDLDWRLQGQEEALGLLGLTDLHRGNVVYRLATRQAVLFDCLYRPSLPVRKKLSIAA